MATISRFFPKRGSNKFETLLESYICFRRLSELCFVIIILSSGKIAGQILPATTTLQPQILPTATVQPPLLQIRIGMLIPQNDTTPYAFENSAAAVSLALDRVYKEKILPKGTNFTFIWKFEECQEFTSAGFAYDLIKNQGVDLIIAPPCITGAAITGHVATYYNIPITLWGVTFTSSLADPNVYPSEISVVPKYNDFANAVCNVMRLYKWTTFSFIFQADDNGGCNSFQRDMETAANGYIDCTIGFKDQVTLDNVQDINFTLQQIQQRSRIVVLCFDDPVQKRDFAIRLYDAGMATAEYVYLFIDSDLSLAYEPPFWADRSKPSDGRDSAAEAVAKGGFQMHVDVLAGNTTTGNQTDFSNKLMERMSAWPFYCTTCNTGQKASKYAPFLYDAMYAYALALSKTINESGTSPASIRNGTRISDAAGSLTFKGMTGTVIMGSDGVRDSTYTLSMYNEKNELVPLVQFGMIGNEVNITPLYSNAATSIWASRGGVEPLAIPVCGFDRKGCQVPVFEAYKALFIVLVCIVLTIITIIISGIGYIIHVRARETEAQNRLWRITYVNLVKFQHKNRGEQSVRSLQSGPSSTSTKFTFDSVKHSKNFTVYTLFDQKVIGHKHSSLHPLEKEQMAELRGMRALDHENVNRFIGLCVDGREVLSIWRYCSRGSLRDVIKNQTLTVDAFFMFSLVRDVAEGLSHIHNSFLGFHGHLKSSYCLIDERWQVKISYYGLKTLIRRDENPKPRELLWTAPELLRENNYVGSKAGDIYSFAIICSEVINQKMAWELNENVGNNEEIVYLLKKGASQLHPLRPVIQPAVQDVNPGIVHLLRDCWAENPNDRPKMEMVKQLLKSMNSGRNSNLMDHVFNILEQYANTLESEVEERTKELVEEKKKSDILLYRMLPKQVAEKLKLGQSVEPETFECVTVFFSDVVSFTTLANRCTPLQVVNLLNTLYSQLDNIIAEHDVYKVETIGDGYLCVSGLPHRNSNEHARHIANMSLGFIKSLDDVVIPHMPNEQIRLRIGLHTGPCVAGVVGLSMPRYCLFGDTINTASRMESSSKPNQIHISATTNHFLTNIIGGYVTESRGELIIKGKGVMETFFLISKVETAQEHIPMYGHFKENHAGDNDH